MVTTELDFVWPSDLDISKTLGDGELGTELQWSPYMKALQNNFVETGFTFPATDPDLVIDLSAGFAFIDGFRVEFDAVKPITVIASQTNHIFLVLSKDGSNKVDDVLIQQNTTGATPSDPFVKLARVITDGSSVTSTIDDRPKSPYRDALVVGPTLGTLAGFALQTGGSFSGTGDIPGVTITATPDFFRGIDTKILVVGTGRVSFNTGYSAGNIREVRMFDNAAELRQHEFVAWSTSAPDGTVQNVTLVSYLDVTDPDIDHVYKMTTPAGVTQIPVESFQIAMFALAKV